MDCRLDLSPERFRRLFQRAIPYRLPPLVDDTDDDARRLSDRLENHVLAACVHLRARGGG
jgi:hypothetical protein